jgi:phenylpyruvate tautomerase
MPLLRILTSQKLDPDASSKLASKASQTVSALLGKPERYVMVSVEHNPAMLFAGTDAPLAYLELKSIGLPENATGNASKILCDLVADATGTDPARIYIEFSNASGAMWGWNRDTF